MASLKMKGTACRVIVLLVMAGGAISCVVERGWKRREVAGSGDTSLPRFGTSQQWRRSTTAISLYQG